MPKSFVLLPDAEIKNADWPKRTPDHMSDLQREKSYRHSRDEFEWREEDDPRSPKGTPGGGRLIEDPDASGQGEFPLSDKRGRPPKKKEVERKALSQREIVELLDKHTSSTPLTSDDLLDSDSVHKVYLVQTEDGRQWIVKPVDPEAREPSHSDLGRAIEDGGTQIRDVAGSEIAEIVGLDDMVPKVAMGEVMIAVGDDPDDEDDLNEVNASIAEFVPEAKTAARTSFDAVSEDEEKAAYFDFILGNTDRHEGNWMVTKKDQRMKLIDNDMILPDYDLEGGFDNDLRGDVRINYMMLRNRTLKVKQSQLARWVDNRSKIVGYLRDRGFASGVIDGFNSRLDRLINSVLGNESWGSVLATFDRERTGEPNLWGHA